MKAGQLVFVLFGLVAAAPDGAAYSLLGCSWASGPIPLTLQLDATAPAGVGFPLQDGSRSWNSIALAAMNDWNSVLGRSHFTGTESSSTTLEYGDGISQVLFANEAYGMAFSRRFLAVTYVQPLEGDRDYVRMVEADVVVSLEFAWNSYRGASRAPNYDIRRVLLHEFGHVLGLAHPDEATPRQNVTAIMNSSSGMEESVYPDDRAGTDFLYQASVPRPIITTQALGQTFSATTPVTLAVNVDGRSPPLVDAFHSQRWYFRPPGGSKFESLFTLHQPGNLRFPSVQPADAGTYFLRVVTPDDTVDSEEITLAVTPLAPAATTRLANLSTRGVAGSGSRAMIVGFVVNGSRPKSVLIRAIGPTLRGTPFNLGSASSAVSLSIVTAGSAQPATVSPTRWDSGPDAAAIRAATGRVGAFSLPAGSFDGVVLATLPPGSHTAQATTNDNGLVLIEVYDADIDPDTTSRLGNLSARGFVNTGADVLIAGFVVNGSGPRDYLIRIAGDTLKDFGLPDTLDDPFLRVYRSDGTLVRELDDWDCPGSLQPMLRELSAQVGAFALSDRQECVMRVTLPPGAYTAHVDSYVGPTTVPSGVALIELYELPMQPPANGRE